MNGKTKYEIKADMLLRAIDLVYEFYKNDSSLTEANLDFINKIFTSDKNLINTSKRMSYLTQIETELFTYFNEASGKKIDAFWEQIKLHELDFERKDLLKKILKRGKIRGTIEFDFVTDSMVALRQDGRITEAQYADLSRMIGEFENKQK